MNVSSPQKESPVGGTGTRQSEDNREAKRGTSEQACSSKEEDVHRAGVEEGVRAGDAQMELKEQVV